MNHPSLVVRRNRRTTVVAAASLTAALTTTLTGAGLTGAGFGAQPAQAAADPACTPYVGDLNAGDAVHGLTTSSGTTPDPFTGEVLGTLKDGIAPGLDMIMVRLSSPEINRVGGIWQGMSGSPVYAADGTLIGAVAYGLALGPSPVAGLTPAAAMFDAAAKGDGTAASAKDVSRVDLSSSLERRIVSSGAASAKEVDGGLAQIRTPVGVSGSPTAKQLRKLRKKLDIPNAKYMRAAAAPSTPGDPGAIRPGGNLGVSISYGFFSATAFGTVTAVCDGKVIGFGHPFYLTGPSSMTMQSANTLYIQEDPTLSPFVVPNATGPVGTITQDRLAAVAGALGDLPPTTEIRTRVSTDNNGNGVIDPGTSESHTGTTYVSFAEFVPDVAFYANIYNELLVFDRDTAGSATGHFVVHGSSDESGPFTLTRSNRYESDWSILFESSFEAPSALYELWANRFSDVTIDDVSIDTRLTPEQRVFTIKKVQRRMDGRWVTLPKYSRIRAESGDTLTFRVSLDSYRGRFGTKVKKVTVQLPKVRGRAFGELSLLGGQSGFFSGGRATSFDGVLAALSDSPRNDQLITRLDLRRSNGPRVRETGTTQLKTVVRGSRYYSLRIG